jgi:hypothetical protein
LRGQRVINVLDKYFELFKVCDYLKQEDGDLQQYGITEQSA